MRSEALGHVGNIANSAEKRKKIQQDFNIPKMRSRSKPSPSAHPPHTHHKPSPQRPTTQPPQVGGSSSAGSREQRGGDSDDAGKTDFKPVGKGKVETQARKEGACEGRSTSTLSSRKKEATRRRWPHACTQKKLTRPVTKPAKSVQMAG